MNTSPHIRVTIKIEATGDLGDVYSWYDKNAPLLEREGLMISLEEGQRTQAIQTSRSFSSGDLHQQLASAEIVLRASYCPQPKKEKD